MNLVDYIKLLIIIPIAFASVVYVMWATRDGEVFVEDALSEATGSRGAPTHFELFHAHAQAVEETVEHMLSAVNAAADGNDPEDEIAATVAAELRADNMKNDIRKRIGTGQMSILQGRDELLYMLSRQDRIADYAQNVAEQLSFRPLFDNQEARTNLMKMAEAVVATVRRYEDTAEQLKNLSHSGFTAKEKRTLHRLIREVNRLEHEADEVERDSAAYVFSEGDDDPLAAMHMYRVLQRLDDVANACELAANAFLPIVLV